jgi:glycosyltransferase involved in cell wall biosynthesis
VTSINQPLYVPVPAPLSGSEPGREVHDPPSARVPALPRRLTTIRAAGGAPPSPPRVLLVTEGTYPFHYGGVSTWCEALVRALPEVPFTVLALEAYESPGPVFELPPNVVEVRSVPLWGLQDVKETWRNAKAGALHASRMATTDEVIQEEFVPALRGFLRAIFLEAATDRTSRKLAADVHAMYRFLVDHDLNATLRSQPVWRTCTSEMGAGYARSSQADAPTPALWELTTGFQWLSRWLFPLARPLPEVDVVHAAMAGTCSMVAVTAKLEHGAGYFLTEHGVYLRERYLAEADRTDSHFLKVLGLRYARRMTEMSYALADQISPCCDYNQRWELEVGATPDQLETVYYGLDGEEYDAGAEPTGVPTRVVWVGRINPLKDVETLLRAAAAVGKARPDVRFRLYGSAPAEDADYNQRCLALHAELDLHDTVEFCGYTDDPTAAYTQGDIVVLSSVSEGFPYSTLEAMHCGRPIVATSVGGIPEQIEGAGIAVEPRNPQALADALLSLLNDAVRCRALGVAARERAAERFAGNRFRGAHYSTYLRLSPRHDHWQHDVVDIAGHRLPVETPALPDGPRVPASGQALDDLAAIVRRRAPRPVDSLEVAAVLESSGVTDAVARENYGYADSFRLAEDVLEATRRGLSADHPADPPARSAAATTAPGSHLDSARHPMLAVLPSASLLIAVWAYSNLGGWTGDRVLALTIGMTVGMLSSNGLALAMGRRASTLISLGKIPAARRFFLSCIGLGLLMTAALTQVLLLLPWQRLAFLAQDRTTFLVAALALAAIWLLAAALSLVSISGWTGVSLSAGVGTGIVTDRALAPVAASHLTVATAVGLAVVLSMMALALDQMLRRRPPTMAAVGSALPSLGYLALEGFPYFVYGTLGVIIFFSVHVMGWAHLATGSPDLTTLELGLFLPLAPAVLGSGCAERSLRLFWVRANDLQSSTPARKPDLFGVGLYELYRQELRHYLRTLLAASACTVVIGELLIMSGLLLEVTHYTNEQALQVLFLTALLAYAAFGWAQFSSMFCLSFMRCAGPLRAAVCAALVTPLLGWALADTFGYGSLGVALLAGATAYAILSFLSVRRLLAAADYHYVMAL